MGSSFLTTVGVAMSGKDANFVPSLQNWESAVVTYGKQQGFTVSTK